MRLYQQGKLSEVEANDIWGIYGYYLSWRFDRHADGGRVAAPSLATIKRSSGPLTHGQLEAMTAVTEHERHSHHGIQGLALLEGIEHRISRPNRAWWLTCVADAAESVGDLALAETTYEEAIRSPPRKPGPLWRRPTCAITPGCWQDWGKKPRACASWIRWWHWIGSTG